MNKKHRWWRGQVGLVAGTLLGASLMGLPRECRADPLVPQLALCLPDSRQRISEEGIPDFTTRGYANDPSRMGEFFVKYVLTAINPSSTTSDDAYVTQAIADTQRLEICWINAAGQISCPAQDGQNEWLIFDKSVQQVTLGIDDIKQDPSEVITSTAIISDSNASTSKLKTHAGLSLNWDSPINQNKILFLVVNGKKPQSLDQIKNELAGGYCPLPTRIAKASDKPQGQFSSATSSGPGDSTPESTHFVAYGIPDDFAVPPGWNLGSVCAPGQANKTNYANSFGPCINRDMTRFGLDIVVGVDQWQRDVFQQFLPEAEKVPTWQNKVGYPGSTCEVGKICPTRVLWMPYLGGAGYNWGGKHTTWHNVLQSVVEPMSFNMGAHLRNTNHELFHGLQETHLAVFGKTFFTHLDISESTATTAEVASCVKNYPGNSDGSKFDADRCVSGRTLYGFYNAGLTTAKDYLAFPESPTASYPGSFFYRYAAAQFAYDSGSKPHPFGPSSASPVGFVLGTDQERDLYTRSPDEGLDLLGYLFQSFARQGNTVCDGLLPASAGVDQHLDCVLSSYLGKGYDDLLLDFHTMLVLKDYAEGDPRWKLAWLGDYNAGAPGKVFAEAPSPISLRSLKPLVKPTSVNKGEGYPLFPTQPLPDQLPRVRRTQDTYLCVNPSNCTAANRQIETLQVGQTRASAQPISVQRRGSSYVSLHPAAGYGALEVRLKVEQGQPRFRVFTVDNTGLPSLAASCNQGTFGSERCPVSDDGEAIVALNVPPGGTIDEVLIVSSVGSDGPARYSWRMGPTVSRLAIVQPTSGNPAGVGTADSPKPFTMVFTALGADDKPINAVNDSNLVVYADGAKLNQPGECPGPTCAFQLNSYAQGTYQAIVKLPASFHASHGPGSYDLKIEASGTGLQPATALLSIRVDSAPEATWTSLLLDLSGSMSAFGKLDAAKAAAHLVVDAHVEGVDHVGLDVFSTLSATFVPALTLTAAHRGLLHQKIDELYAGGSTSIGNGLFRASSNLFSATPAETPSYGILLMTDGKSNCEHGYTKFLFGSGITADNPPIAGTAGEQCELATVPAWAQPQLTPDNKVKPYPPNHEASPEIAPALGYAERKAKGYPVPKVSTVAVGPDTDVGLLNLVSDATGGASYAIPTTEESQALFFSMAESFRGGHNSFAGFRRVLSKTRPSTQSDTLWVEPGTEVLLVSALVYQGTTTGMALESPAGEIYQGLSTAPERVVFRVTNPPSGVWNIRGGQGSITAAGSAPTYIEAVVKGGCQVQAKVTAAGQEQQSGAGVWAGRELRLSAVLPRDLGGSALARVIDPRGLPHQVELFDDGKHDDGAALDGVFAASFPGTTAAGLYEVQIDTAGLRAFDRCASQQKTALQVIDAPDLDVDGLPDWWQQKFTLGSNQAQLDLDNDGLTNLQEFLAATRPDVSDSDGGGESDASEIAAGRDPLSPGDDALGKPTLAVLAGNEKVLLQPGVSLPEGQWLEVWSGPSLDAPRTLVATTEQVNGIFLSVGAPNGEPRCYQSRLRSEGAIGGWSNVVCATPRPDPVGPVVRGLSLSGGSLCVARRQATLKIEAADDGTSQRSHDERLIDPETVQSGIESMRIRQGAAWGPWASYNEQVTVDMGAARESTLWVQLRDYAGNEGEEISWQLKRCQEPGVEAAILLEEAALDALSAGKYAEAKALILKSLPEIDREIAHLISHLELPKHGAPRCLGQAEEVKALAQLFKIRIEKTLAAGLSKSATKKVAQAKLSDALKSEYLIVEAQRRGPQ